MLESEQIRIEGDILVLALKGRLTLGSRLSQLEAEVKSLAEIGKRKVILDLEEIEYADSAALGVLLHSTVLMRNKGGRLLLAGPNQRLQDLFTLTNTTPLLNIVEDRAAAIAELG